MEKEFKLVVGLTESQVTELLDSLSADEKMALDLADHHLDTAFNFGDFLKKKGLVPENNDMYEYHLNEAQRLRDKAWLLGDLFDLFIDALYKADGSYHPGDF